jgi:hypothetical protein
VLAFDVDGDAMAFSLTSAPAHGALLLLPDGRYTYTPEVDYYGTDSFSFLASDGDLLSNIATVSVTVVPGSLDVDLNGSADATTDGILMLRYLFGLTGSVLVDGVVDPAGQRTNSNEITAYLDQKRHTMLDVDGNGQADALSDGIVIVRYLFGFTGDNLINGAVDPAGTRNTAPAIEALLQSSLPMSPPIAGLAAELAGTESSATTTASITTSSVVVTDQEEPTTDLSLAYVQRSWVKGFVAEGASLAEEEEELLIALPG